MLYAQTLKNLNYVPKLYKAVNWQEKIEKAGSKLSQL